jgi:hypothetical protein
VDYAKAKAQVETWASLLPGDRQPSKHGLWMRHIFTANDVEALRIGSDGPEVPLILQLKEARYANLPPHRVEILRRKRDKLPFTEKWRAHLVDLMNELALSYLEQLIVDLSFPDGTELSAVGHALFPKCVAPDPANLSEWAEDDFYDYHTFVSEGSYLGLNFEDVQSRSKDFLVSKSQGGASTITFDGRLIAAIIRVMVAAIANALEASSDVARDNGHTGIVTFAWLSMRAGTLFAR